MKKPNLDRLNPSTTDKVIAPAKDLATLEAELAELESDDHDSLEGTVLQLSDYLSAVEMVVKQTFAHHVWVKAEIRNLSNKGGHYYFELAEKNDDGKVVASARGNLWRFKAARVLGKFERATGMALERDLTVLLKVSASFHVQYGFALTIEDIDPSYTLGDLARQYAQMVDKLSGEGLLHLNGELPAPFDIEHVIVIAPEKAAGLGDFRADADRLANTGACEFHYHHATFQGNHAPAEIREAITRAQSQFFADYQRLPDLLVIIRGGGAVGDLAYLNDYELAALVAEQPVPVWVGIGHERDRVILDEVAHTSFDTPSKVIAAITNHLSQLIAQTQRYQAVIKQTAQQQIKDAQQQTEQTLIRLHAQTLNRLTALKKDSRHARASIIQSARWQIKQAATMTSDLRADIHHLADEQVKRARHNSAHLRDIILLQHPARVMQRGYGIIKDNNGHIITSSRKIDRDQSITLELKDGSLAARVTDVQIDD